MKLSEVPGAEGPPAPGGAHKLSQVSDTQTPQGDKPADEGVLGALFRGFLPGFMQGFNVEGPPPILPGASAGKARVDAAIQNNFQQAQQAHPLMAGAGNIAGNIAATAPLMGGAAGATIPARVGLGAARGAVAGAMAPTEGGDYWKEKGKQVLGGLVAGGAVGGIGGAIGPPLSQAAQDVISKFPYVANIVRGVGRRTPDNFNRSVVNQALDPIGVTAPPNMKAGRGLIEWGQDRLTDAYNKVLPKLSMMADPDFTQEISALKQAATEMAPDQEKQFLRIIEGRLEKRLANGVMDGQTLKQVESELGKKASAYAGSSDAAQRELADHLYAARESMMDAAMRQNPEAANELKNVNSAYAMFARVQSAAARRADSEGIFTPQDLLMSAKVGDKSAGKRNFAAGGAMMQALAEATKGPMAAPKVNGLIGPLLGGAAGAHFGGMIGGGAGAVLGSQAAPAVAGAAVRATQTPAARALGTGVSKMAPAAGRAAGSAVDRMKASRKVGELQTKLYAAKRRGALDEVKKLTEDLAEAHSDYRRLAPIA